MIRATPSITIDEKEIELDFVRSSGPGGQNVNKVSTAVQLRFDVKSSPALTERVRQRMMRIAGGRITRDGILVIEARRHRSQLRNRQDAVHRLVQLVRRAAEPERERHRTKPSAASKERRLRKKRRRSELKKLRRAPGNWDG